MLLNGGLKFTLNRSHAIQKNMGYIFSNKGFLFVVRYFGFFKNDHFRRYA